MYNPSVYRQENGDLTLQLLRDAPFAVLLTPGGEQVSHIPLLLEESKGAEPTLLGHMARANPHWRELQKAGRAKAIFQGPHAYISPAWYAPQRDNVPTWNYAVVHVTGRFELIEEPKAAFDAMDRLVNAFETAYETGWKLPQGEAEVEAMMKGIVVFKFTGLQLDAKFKLSQKQDLPDRENVIAKLRERGGDLFLDLADKMEDALSGANV